MLSRVRDTHAFPSSVWFLLARIALSRVAVRFLQITPNAPLQIRRYFHFFRPGLMGAMSEDRSEIMQSCRRSMVPVQLHQRGSVTIPRLGAAAARAIVMPPVPVSKQVEHDFQRLDFVRQAELST